MSFTNLGEFLGAVRSAKLCNRPDPRLPKNAALGVGTSAYPVPSELSTALIDGIYAETVLAQRCLRLPSPKSGKLMIPSIDEDNRTDGSRYGGISSAWMAEGDALTPSQPKFKSANTAIRKVGCLVYATGDMVEDTVGLGEVITIMASGELGFRLDSAIIRGSGAKQPLGFLNAPSLITVSKESGQTAATIVVENVLAMLNRLDPRSYRNAAWFINMECWQELYSMAQVVGTGGVPVFSLANTKLCGLPVIPVEQCSVLGTVGDIVLADLSQYFLVEHPLRVQSSVHVEFLTDQVAYRIIYRVDGQSSWSSAITPANGGSTVSPFIVLETRS